MNVLNLHQQDDDDDLVARNMSDFSDLQLFIEADVGSPPQRMRLIADTGSEWMWVQTDLCHRCSGENFFEKE